MGWIKQENVKIEEGKRGVDGTQDRGRLTALVHAGC